MNSNQKKFGLYVFLSTFSRNLIEVFIPILLYKYGYNLKEIVFYFFIANLVSLILTYPFIYISNKYNNKLLSILGIISFSMLQIYLNLMTHSISYLIILATLYAVYRRGYWISRRFYNLKIMDKQKISTTYSIISIINQIGVIISAYFGSIILDFINLQTLTVIAIILFLSSIIPLHFLKFVDNKSNEKIELLKTLKQIPKSNIYLFGSYELLNVVKFFIPLYLFIYVKNTYQTVGIFNLVTNLSLISFTYLFGKRLDNSKNNYLKLAILLTVLTYLIKVNVVGYLLLLISIVEGIVIKMYELAINKEFYTLSKNFEYNNYNLVYELTQNFFRCVVLILFVFINLDLKIMIYVTLIFIAMGIFLKFKHIQVSQTTYNYKK